MSTINIKVKHKKENILRVRDLSRADVFTLKQCPTSHTYMLTNPSNGLNPAGAVNLGTGELRTIAGDMVVDEKFSKIEITLTP